jgi:hypothetical protein
MHTGGPEGDDYCDEHAAEWEKKPPSCGDEPRKACDQEYGPELRAVLTRMEEWDDMEEHDG